MRLVFSVVLLASLTAPAVSQSKLTTADLVFMTGCWRFETKGRIVDEQWMAPGGGSLMGMSRTVVNGKTTEFEFVQIRDLPEGLTYIARPSNQPEASFIANPKGAGVHEVVFENPSHDFPQRIRYRHDGNMLYARVEGTMNGSARWFEFPYTRTNCTP